MGLVMGMGWDEGGSLSPVETFLGCLSPVGLSSQLSVRGKDTPSFVSTLPQGEKERSLEGPVVQWSLPYSRRGADEFAY